MIELIEGKACVNKERGHRIVYDMTPMKENKPLNNTIVSRHLMIFGINVIFWSGFLLLLSMLLSL